MKLSNVFIAPKSPTLAADRFWTAPVIVCCDDEAWMDNSDRMGRGERTLLMGCGRVASPRSQDPVSSFPNTNVAMCVDYLDFIIIIIIIIIIITTANIYKLQETVSSLFYPQPPSRTQM